MNNYCKRFIGNYLRTIRHFLEYPNQGKVTTYAVIVLVKYS